MTTIDRIEIIGKVFTGPRPGNYPRADFDRPREPVRFSLIAPINCPYYIIDGLNNLVVANAAAEIVGPGFYGANSYRVVDN